MAATVCAANAVMTAPTHLPASRLKRRRPCMLLRVLLSLLRLRLNQWLHPLLRRWSSLLLLLLPLLLPQPRWLSLSR